MCPSDLSCVYCGHGLPELRTSRKAGTAPAPTCLKTPPARLHETKRSPRMETTPSSGAVRRAGACDSARGHNLSHNFEPPGRIIVGPFKIKPRSTASGRCRAAVKPGGTWQPVRVRVALDSKSVTHAASYVNALTPDIRPPLLTSPEPARFDHAISPVGKGNGDGAHALRWPRRARRRVTGRSGRTPWR